MGSDTKIVMTERRRFVSFAFQAALVLAGAILVVSCATVSMPSRCAAEAEDGYIPLGIGIEYRIILRDAPRPLRIHVVRGDPGAGSFTVRTPLAPDPDGPGPAEAALEDPLRLARLSRALVLVNASSFAVLGYSDGTRPPLYLRGMGVDISGLAASGGRIASPSNPRYAAVLVDGGGKPRIADTGEAPELEGEVREAAAGFSPLVIRGEETEQKGRDIEPRTAVGLDGSGRILFVVAEGRRPGRSEGLTLEELARLMRDLSCVEALNLDGGGSSILVLRIPGRGLRILTPPTDGTGPFRFRRPIPNALILTPSIR